MVEWPLFNYCWIGLLLQLIVSDLLVGHPGAQLFFFACLVVILTAMIAYRRDVRTAGEWWWLLVGTMVNWLLLLPVGALGSTVSLTALLPIPTPVLRILILRRWQIVPVLVLCWLAIGYWWLRSGRRFILARVGGVLRGVPWNGDHALLMIGATILALLSGIFVQTYCSDVVAAAWWLLIVTMMLSYWLAAVVKWFWQLPADESTRGSSAIAVRILGIGLVAALGTVFLIQQASSVRTNHPLVISHRGVNGNNGVPNTLQSLRRTAKLHPDRVETDVQLTKNDRFITFHDSNLRKMTGHGGQVRQYTLKQLAHQKAYFGGYQTRLTPFHAYLVYAQDHRVPLIVELKPQKKVAPATIVDHFASQYGLGTGKRHFWIHTADLKIASMVQKKQPNAQIGLVLPFVVTEIPLNADFYCINYHMLNKNLVVKLHRHHKKVYAWTVNRPADAYRMKQLGVDGIITNNYAKILEISGNNKYILSNQVFGKLLELF